VTDGILDDSSSNFGIAVFDNMILGFVTVFQMVTLEGWSDIMYNLMDATVPAVSVIFCCLVVVVGSFFLLNVVLAVIMEAFEDVDKNA
jgi:voltage-dependent calcium channel L type alpha-1D